MKMMLPWSLFVFLFACGGGSHNETGIPHKDNQAVVHISPVTEKGLSKGPFTDATHILDFSEAVVKEGSYSGIEIVFAIQESQGVTLFLGFELPAAKTMKVFLGSEGVKAEMPAVPFKVTQEDFKGLKNALYETEQSTYVYLKREKRNASGNIGSESFYFGKFELNVTKADFGPRKFSMDCSFKACGDSSYIASVGMNYTVEGNFSVVDGTYGIAEVD